MSIFFDARFIRVGHTDGVSRFAINLFRELCKILPVTAIVSNEDQLAELPEGCDHILECPVDSPRELGFAKRMNARGASLVFSPMQTTGGIGRKFKLVLTIHDLIYYRHRTPPREFNPLVRLLWRAYHLSFWPQRLLLKKADALVTVSETSKREISAARLFRGPIEVIPNAVDERIRQAPPVRSLIHESATKENDYPPGQVIYMGSFMPYKDVETLIRGCSKNLNNVELHLASPIDERRRNELSNLAARENTDVIFHNGLTDDQYVELLDSCALLVTASRAEGFCIPLVEGFARGVPAVCSDLPVLREVGADAAEYFEPGNPQALGSAIRRALGTRENLSSKALERAKAFSWKSSAQKLADLLEKLAKRPENSADSR